MRPERLFAERRALWSQALDVDSVQVLVTAICTAAGAWEPKPFAKRVGVPSWLTADARPQGAHTPLVCDIQGYILALAQLVDVDCPVRDLILHGQTGYLPKLLAYVRRHMQVLRGGRGCFARTLLCVRG